MPAISVPRFSRVKQFAISEFGADCANQQKTSEAITRAIDAASDAGGGVVFVPEGIWPCTAIHLKSNVNLHLSKGAVLLFSETPEDYLPGVKTSWEGMECINYSPLIYAYECENVAITGEGTLQAKLDIWTSWYERPKAHMKAIESLYKMAAEAVPLQERDMTYEGANLRPHFIQFNRCRQVLVEGISIKNSPFWVMHPYLCKDVIVRRVKIEAHGHNNDGVDPEMTQNMLIEDCVFDQGDDAISVKAGRDSEAWKLNTPCKNIVMRNCTIKNGHHLLAIGSELSGGIENIFIENCHFENGSTANREYVEGTPDADSFGNLVYLKTNAYRGGYVRNVYVHNCSAEKIGGSVIAIETDVLYQWRELMAAYEKRFTHIQGIDLYNITVGEVSYISKIDGNELAPVNDVRLRNVDVGYVRECEIDNRHVVNFEWEYR
ncbi:glycoside hydrolase family 28 protein [Teredinibacter franksiae]|uniref:glycoside hydrolase family 28 protein n=1 Tax=Teredinibacter franksiae TaxID=2761453 RepID=UPI001C8A654E|nr:glycoside hydrolase family 28 protein [Teredinibacter franksiae]